MKKCLKIVLGINMPEGFLHSSVQKHARSFDIEGTAQIVMTEKQVRIIACGKKDKVDDFIDTLHKDFAHAKITDFEIEPFLKDRDYRGVFRIIE